MLSQDLVNLLSAASGEISVDPGNGVQLRSTDGRSAVTFSPRVQLRGTLARDGAWLGQFTVRRARLDVNAYLLSKSVAFRLQLAFSPADVDLADAGEGRQPMLDAYADIRLVPLVSARLGLMKVPFIHERMMSSSRFRFVDRSVVDSEFSFDRDYGGQLMAGHGAPDWLRFHAGIYTGQGFDGYQLHQLGPLFVLRGQVLWGDIDPKDELAHDQRGIALGLGYAFIDDATKDRGTKGRELTEDAVRDLHQASADLIIKGYGAALAIESSLRQSGPGPAAPRDGIAYRVEGSWDHPRGYLAAVRWSELRPMGDSSITARSEIGFALAAFIGDHVAKLSADFTHAFNPNLSAPTEQQMRLQLDVRL